MPHLACEAFATTDDLIDTVCEGQLVSPTDDVLMQGALDSAADILVRVSGHRFFGECTHTIRPCRDACFDSWCGCCVIDRLPLVSPVISITSVKIDGVTLVASTYKILTRGTRQYLVRVALTGGTRPDPWPGCQKLWLPTTDEDTFEIVYVSGHEVSLVEKQANIELALAIIQSSPDRSVLAIKGATSVSGGGVVIDSNTSDQDIIEAAANMPSVSNFLSKWNPGQDRVPAMAWAPELDEGWAMSELS
jgi:hypothetical protein